MTPQDLMNLPYAGMAEKQLRIDRRWDDTVAFDGVTEFNVTVNVRGTYYPDIETQRITVTATSKNEAIDLAEKLSDFDEIEYCEIDEMENLE